MRGFALSDIDLTIRRQAPSLATVVVGMRANKAVPRDKGRASYSSLVFVGLGVVATACAAIFSTVMPAAAKDYEYCRRDITSYMLQCGFDTFAQCQDVSFGRGGDCFRNPSLGSAAGAYVYAPGIRKTYAYAPRRQK